MVHYGVFVIKAYFRLWLTAIYGLNKLEQRRVLWRDLVDLNLRVPWCLIGEFNNIIKAQYRIGGNIIIEAEVRDLQELMDRKELSEVARNGDFYTWSNKHSVGGIYYKLTKFLETLSGFNHI